MVQSSEIVSSSELLLVSSRFCPVLLPNDVSFLPRHVWGSGLSCFFSLSSFICLPEVFCQWLQSPNQKCSRLELLGIVAEKSYLESREVPTKNTSQPLKHTVEIRRLCNPVAGNDLQLTLICPFSVWNFSFYYFFGNLLLHSKNRSPARGRSSPTSGNQHRSSSVQWSRNRAFCVHFALVEIIVLCCRSGSGNQTY